LRSLFLAFVVLAAALAAGARPALAGRAAPEIDEALAVKLKLQSSSALVLDQQSGEILYGKNTQAIVPIASITKLMTAMVVLDANLDPGEKIPITQDDVDWLRGSHSRLRVGAPLTRDELLRIALMASENRAASALGRSYPGGLESFVRAMNLKAQLLGMNGSRFADPTGLSSTNVSTAEDLATLVRSAHRYAKIRQYSTSTAYAVSIGGRHPVAFRNTNRLVGTGAWDIGLSKTGFINEAGRCLVMQATLAGRAVIIVLLDSWGKYSRIGDANRIRKWLEIASGHAHSPNKAAAAKARRLLLSTGSSSRSSTGFSAVSSTVSSTRSRSGPESQGS
jgi:D-alanyl-D-alanine endopeptidase (penicillin-binding protein 7)